MANWRDNILKHFKPKISRLTLVADPDGLLTEERMLSAIRERAWAAELCRRERILPDLQPVVILRVEP